MTPLRCVVGTLVLLLVIAVLDAVYTLVTAKRIKR